MPRIVLDTNVLAAAARSKLGASHRLLSFLPAARFEPAISIPVFMEYSAVLQRPENRLGRTPQQVETFLTYVLSISHIQEIFFLWRPFLTDADDDMILELAVAAQCRYIVTHNVADFRDCERFGIEAITPGRFLRQIGEST